MLNAEGYVARFSEYLFRENTSPTTTFDLPSHAYMIWNIMNSTNTLLYTS